MENRTVDEKVNNEHLEILEVDTTEQTDIKEKFRKEYLRRKILETKPCSLNLIKNINNSPFIRYYELFLNWTRGKVNNMRH